MIIELSARPLLFFIRTKPFWLVLTLPLIRGALQYALYKEVSETLYTEVSLIAAALIFTILETRNFKVQIFSGKIVTKNGFFIKKTKAVEIEKISLVLIKANLIEEALGLARVFIFAEYAERRKGELRFRVRKKNLKILEGLLFDGSQN